MDILNILSVIENAYSQLKSKNSQKELEELFDYTEDFKEKVIKMYQIGTDAADDAVNIFLLTVSVCERLVTSRSRDLLETMSPFDQVVDEIIEEVQPGRLIFPATTTPLSSDVE